MPSSSSSNAFARRVRRVSAFPSRTSAIRSARVPGSRKPPRIIPLQESLAPAPASFFINRWNRGIELFITSFAYKLDSLFHPESRTFVPSRVTLFVVVCCLLFVVCCLLFVVVCWSCAGAHSATAGFDCWADRVNRGSTRRCDVTKDARGQALDDAITRKCLVSVRPCVL